MDVEGITSAQHENAVEDREVVNGIRYRRTRSVRRIRAPLAREWFLMRALERAISRAIEEFSPAVVHAHSPMLVALPALRAARKAGLPLVYEVRDLWENTSVDLGKFTHGSLRYRLARAGDSFVLGRADAVVTICQSLRQAVESRVARDDRLYVVDNGVDSARFTARTPEVGGPDRWRLRGQAVVAYVGTFQPYEGLDLLVEAVEEVVRARPTVRLMIVGEGAMEGFLRGRIAQRGLEHAITLTGRLSQEEVVQVYAAADVLVYPRRLTRTTAVTTPLKPLEAMAMSKAVLAADVPALRELVEPGVTGVVFRPGDAGDLARQLTTLLDCPELRQRLGASARTWVAGTRDWSTLVGRYHGIYGAVLRSRGTRKKS